jgi:hypothetical protein
MAPVWEGKSIGLDRKIVLKGELLIWRTQSNSRIQFASNQSKLVPRKLDPGPIVQSGHEKSSNSNHQIHPPKKKLQAYTQNKPKKFKSPNPTISLAITFFIKKKLHNYTHMPIP